MVVLLLSVSVLALPLFEFAVLLPLLWLLSMLRLPLMSVCVGLLFVCSVYYCGVYCVTVVRVVAVAGVVVGVVVVFFC